VVLRTAERGHQNLQGEITFQEGRRENVALRDSIKSRLLQDQVNAGRPKAYLGHHCRIDETNEVLPGVGVNRRPEYPSGSEKTKTLRIKRPENLENVG